MVEMKEACNAITNATPNSLILFDELGRGTATYDGMSLAQAILEYISKNIKCKTLFSTHYHELTSLANEIKTIKNVHVEAHEENGTVTFLHKVSNGPIDKSYGIHVARLAKMPEELLKRATTILKEYEDSEKHNNIKQVSLFDLDDEESKTIKVKEEEIAYQPQPQNEKLLTEINNLNLDNLRPIDALTELYKLKELVNK